MKWRDSGRTLREHRRFARRFAAQTRQDIAAPVSSRWTRRRRCLRRPRRCALRGCAWVAAWLSLATSDCTFDRTPLVREHDAAHAVGSVPAVMDAASADTDIQFDASVVSTSDASLTAQADAAADMTSDAAVSQVPHDPPPPPMSGGLQCGGTFCAFAIDPAKPCCTSADDVTAHAARAPNLCGLDLSAVSAQDYGDRCWQRDQLGIVDERCSSGQGEDGGMGEPGCCTDDGQCGTLNSSQKLGCRHPQSSAALRSCSDDTAASSCDPIGQYAVHFAVDAAWGGRSGGLVALTDDGRGEIQVWILLRIDSIDASTHSVAASGRVCGVRLPAFYSSTLCESYAPQFPDTIWESPDVPPLTGLSGRYECTGAGCALSIMPHTYLLGFEMDNPEAPWPSADDTDSFQCSAGKGVECFPDHDADTRPGVQVDLLREGSAPGSPGCAAGYKYQGAPLNASIAAIFDGVRRADRLELGVRLKLGASLRLDDTCASAQGSALAEYVNSRAAGCLVQPGSYDWPSARQAAGDDDPCDDSEAHFLDANLPIYNVLSAGARPDTKLRLSDRSPSAGPVAQAVRLGPLPEDFGCQDVRAALESPPTTP